MWTLFKDKNPPEEQLIMIFRHKNKKYSHAKYSLLKGYEDENDSNRLTEKYYWVTQQGCCHEPNDLDAWTGFEFYKLPHGEIIFDGNK